MGQQPKREVRIPDESHPIAIAKTPGRVKVRVGDLWIADTANALSLKEASYPAAIYFPLKDVDASVLRESSHATYCPYKGECAYYDVEVDGKIRANAIWYYPEPHASVDLIKDHVAFYPERVDEMLIE
jgi:uncharacterized protein (DUF427 family)